MNLVSFVILLDKIKKDWIPYNKRLFTWGGYKIYVNIEYMKEFWDNLLKNGYTEESLKKYMIEFINDYAKQNNFSCKEIEIIFQKNITAC